MKSAVIVKQSMIFIVQWGLMLVGFGLISKLIAPRSFFPEAAFPLKYADAAVKAFIGLVLSVTWLFIWDRQVRLLFYRRPPAEQ